MERVIVLNARRYSFDDEKTGKRVEGVSVNYVTGDPSSEADRVGVEQLTVLAPLALYGDLAQAPAVYDLDFRHRPGAKGRVTLSLAAARFVAPVDFASFIG